MNRIVVLALAAFMIKNISAMEGLTPQETECFKWFDNQTEIKAQAFKKLSESELIYVSKTKYNEHPEEVKQAVSNYVDHFYSIIMGINSKPSFPYTEFFVKKTLLKIKIAMQNKTIEKPTDEPSARMYTFSQLLSEEEKEAFHKDNYLQNPDASATVVNKWSHLLAGELAKLGLIQNTPEEKDKKAQEYAAKKINELEATYK